MLLTRSDGDGGTALMLTESTNCERGGVLLTIEVPVDESFRSRAEGAALEDSLFICDESGSELADLHLRRLQVEIECNGRGRRYSDVVVDRLTREDGEKVVACERRDGQLVSCDVFVAVLEGVVYGVVVPPPGERGSRFATTGRAQETKRVTLVEGSHESLELVAVEVGDGGLFRRHDHLERDDRVDSARLLEVDPATVVTCIRQLDGVDVKEGRSVVQVKVRSAIESGRSECPRLLEEAFPRVQSEDGSESVIFVPQDKRDSVICARRSDVTRQGHFPAHHRGVQDRRWKQYTKERVDCMT